MSDLFLEIDCRKRRTRQRVAGILVDAALQNDLALIVVRTERWLVDFFRRSPAELCRCRSAVLYSLRDSTVAPFIRDCLLKMRMWHQLVFHILIGEKGLEKELADLCAESKEPVHLVEQALSNKSVCYLQPLDDILEFYGTGEIKEILLQVFRPFTP